MRATQQRDDIADLVHATEQGRGRRREVTDWSKLRLPPQRIGNGRRECGRESRGRPACKADKGNSLVLGNPKHLCQPLRDRLRGTPLFLLELLNRTDGTVDLLRERILGEVTLLAATLQPLAK
jgi:hypothetical protein